MGLIALIGHSISEYPLLLTFPATRARFASEQIIIVAGINELNPIFVFHFLTFLVYTIHLCVGDWRWVFTTPRR